MGSKALIGAFLGGALVGAASAILFAPESGEELREKICSLVRRKGIKISDAEIDALVAELAK